MMLGQQHVDQIQVLPGPPKAGGDPFFLQFFVVIFDEVTDKPCCLVQGVGRNLLFLMIAVAVVEAFNVGVLARRDHPGVGGQIQGNLIPDRSERWAAVHPIGL